MGQAHRDMGDTWNPWHSVPEDRVKAGSLVDNVAGI